MPQPVQYEPDSLPLVSVAADASSVTSDVIVLPVWQVTDKTVDGCSHLLHGHDSLQRLDQASLGGLAVAINTHVFTGQKVGMTLSMLNDDKVDLLCISIVTIANKKHLIQGWSACPLMH